MDAQDGSHDYRSPSGTGNSLPVHIGTFLTWAKRNGVLNISRRLVRVLVDPEEPHLLGAALRFLSDRDTASILEAWSADRAELRSLQKLSVCLQADFPELKVPDPAGRVDKMFSGQLQRCYLGVLLATRRLPKATESEHLSVASMRLWILLKSLEFERHDCIRDTNLQQVSAQVRMALDDKGDPAKLDWLLALSKPVPDRTTYEQLLEQALANAPKAKGAEEAGRAIRLLRSGEMSPAKDENGPALMLMDWPGGEDDPVDEPVVGDQDQPQADTAAGFQSFEVQEGSSPPEILRQGKGLVFQTQEDQQYLSFSWDRPRRDESTALRVAIRQRLSSSNLEQRLLAAMTVIAIVCRKSMETVASIPLSGEVGADWALDLAAGALRRQPARRKGRWRADPERLEWIRRLSGPWMIAPSESVLTALRDAFAKVGNAALLGDLWSGNSKSLVRTFNEWCEETAGLERCTSGLLPRMADGIAFEQSGDAAFARLVTSSANAGIPGSGAYPAWSVDAVARAYDALLPELTAFSGHETAANGLGSELDPDDERLKAEFALAFQKIQGFQGTSWAEYHNLAVTYTLAVLFAATGARPITSPFEALRHIDVQAAMAFVEDKVGTSTSSLRQGRLVPLPEPAVRILDDFYLPYLRQAAAGLARSSPELAEEIERQLAGSKICRIPLFFFVRTKPYFDWFEVSEQALSQQRLFQWPLPWNLFRHRLASRLRQCGLPAELVDAQLGHAEAGSETFGDYSPWCWSDTRALWTERLEMALRPLEIRIPDLRTQDIPSNLVSSDYVPFLQHDGFGRAGRARRRAISHKRVVEAAKRDIASFVESKSGAGLTPDDWDALGRRMLLREGNLPHPNAGDRYRVFEEYAQAAWRNNGSRPQIRKWAARMPQATPANFLESIRAHNVLDMIRRQIASGIEMEAPSRVGRANAAVLAALELCVHGRVADQDVLLAVAFANARQVRVAKMGGHFWVEYSDQPIGSDTAVRRFLLSRRGAELLARSLSAGKELGRPKLAGPWRDGLLSALELPQDADDFRTLRALAAIVDADNSVCFPGIIAGVLSGRTKAFALGAKDWYRAIKGVAVQSPEEEASRPSEQELIEIQVTHRASAHPGEALDTRRQTGRDLLTSLRKIIDAYVSEAKGRKTRTDTDSVVRRDARAKMVKEIRKAEPVVSGAVRALASWTVHLMNRPYGRRLLAAGSVERYMEALAHGFTSFGADLDLADLDADELTEFYCAVVDPLETDLPNPDDLVDDEQDQAAGLSRAAEPPRLYTLRRLQEFHRFAQVQYGLETPDWSEIGEGAISATANPGFIQPTEYRHGLRLLAPDPSQQEIESVQDAFILLLAYRFGLRGSEAAALAQADWVELGGAVVVLVTGTHGKLKTRGSRRQVPLIGALDEHERAIIQRCFMHWEAESAGDNRVPIFFCASDKKRPLELQPVRERIITALRAATGNPRINLHHARHSLANLVGLNVLSAAGVGLWKGADLSCESATSTQLLLLSSTGCSRRNLWAVSRVLGHVQRGTTTGSYLHFLHDWAAETVMKQCPSRFVEDHSIASKGVEDRDQWPQSACYLPELAPVPRQSFNAPTAHALVKYCRLRAQGMVAAAAGQHLQLAASVRLQMEHQLAQAGVRLQGRVPIADDRSVAADLDGALFLLSRVEPHRWAQLEIAAKSSDAPRQPLCPDPCNHIGRSRQILLWQRDHFQTLNYFLAELQWNKEQVVLYRPAKLDDRLSRWAEECGLLLHGNVQGDRKVLQIDKAVVIQPNQVPVTYEHRVAMVRAAHNQVVRTNYELIVLWIAMCLAHSSVQSA